MKDITSTLTSSLDNLLEKQMCKLLQDFDQVRKKPDIMEGWYGSWKFQKET